MKKLKTKNNLKFIILIIIDIIVISNLSLILKDANTINTYRYNWCIISIFVIANVIAMLKITTK